MPNDKLQSLKTVTAVVYALYAAAFFVGLTAIVAIVVNYVKRGDARGSWLESPLPLADPHLLVRRCCGAFWARSPT
ncbi:MAG: hypothetical protein MZV70_39460 [Desulfobacterales bacterium]|nr:hypothetical protein [Desulfobacterales bacterium]